MSDDERQHFDIDPEVEAQQRRAALRTLLVLILLTLVIGAAAFWYLWNWRAEQLGSESVNVLVMGVSDDDVDALFVTTFHPETDTAAAAVSAMAIPVDTRLPWSQELIYVRDAYDATDDDALRHIVEELLAAPVHHTVRVDFSGFVELIDLVQGVPIHVDSDVVYRDADGEIVFELQPGLHRLSGEEALLYLRYKGDHLEDETRRVHRQLRFIEAVAREARANLDWRTVQDMLQIVLNRVETDLDLITMTQLARFAFEAGDDAYTVHVLPGAASDEGWVVDQSGLQALSGRLFYNPSWEAAGR